MKKTIGVVALSLVAVLLVCGIGGYTSVLAQKRLIPIYNVGRTDNKISISFDAAWGADKTEKILDICDEYDVKVTFFLVGFWMEKYPDMVKEISNRGHEIGTHSQTHPKMSTLSQQKIAQELSSTILTIKQLTGKDVEVFRPPFGDYNDTLISTASSLGLFTIQWSIDSLDWKGISAQEIATRVQKMQSGDIILCHNNSDHIVQALPVIFETARLKGLSFVPIGELIFREGYTVNNQGTQVKEGA